MAQQAAYPSSTLLKLVVMQSVDFVFIFVIHE